jgi:hypothetical protein
MFVASFDGKIQKRVTFNGGYILIKCWVWNTHVVQP